MDWDMGVVRQLFTAIAAGEGTLVRDLLTQHPELNQYSSASTPSLLHHAARYASTEIIGLLLDAGVGINVHEGSDGPTCLVIAIGEKHVATAQFLLQHGADPNLGRAIIAAINVEPEQSALEFVKLLIAHGARVDSAFSWFDDPQRAFKPSEWARLRGKAAVAEFLERQGGGSPTAEQPPRQDDRPLSPVIQYFADHVGAVRKDAIVEVVPTDLPISVHVVPPSDDRPWMTLFTVGMSARRMAVPEKQDDFRFAELFIQLPSDWRLDDKGLADPQFNWPILWLRSIAKYPHQHGTWLGGPVTIIANGEPPQPLAPGVAFTSFLLMASARVDVRHEQCIMLYRLMPLFTEERALEMKEGAQALIRALEERGVGMTVDVNRVNAGRTGLQ